MDLSIKDVPEPVVERLRDRAKRNHRSLQGELLTILEDSVARQRISLWELSEYAHELGLHDPREAVDLLRSDRDAH